MSSKPSKRQRANTNGDSTFSTSRSELKEIIATLNEETLRKALLWAATSSCSVAKQIHAYKNATRKAESTRIIDFDYLSKRAGHELQQGQGLKGSRQYHLGLDVSVNIREIVETIQKQTPAHSSFGTKKSALETLRKIGKSLVLRNHDTFGSELVKSLHQDGDPQEKVMLEIVDEMTEDEKARMRENTEWLDKVEELIELGGRHEMYGSLNEMLKQLGFVYETEDAESGASVESVKE